MRNILVTGGLGFIGSNCVEQLLSNNIYVLDNCSSSCVDKSYFGKKVKYLNRRLEEYIYHPHGALLQVRLDGVLDTIYHYASPVGPAGILKHSGNIGNIIISDLMNVIKLCQIHKATLVFISTSEVYGHRSSPVELKEDDDKILRGSYTVRNEYSQAKLLSEVILFNTLKTNPNFKFHIFRPFNVCGPRQKPDGGFVIPRFVQAALSGQPLTVFGDGGQVRSFVHVDDLNKGIESVVASNYLNEVWNLGNPENTISILDLANMIIDISGSKSKIEFVDPKSLYGPTYEEAWDKIADISKITSKTNWRPTKNLEDIINDCISFQLSKMDR